MEEVRFLRVLSGINTLPDALTGREGEGMRADRQGGDR